MKKKAKQDSSKACVWDKFLQFSAISAWFQTVRMYSATCAAALQVHMLYAAKYLPGNQLKAGGNFGQLVRCVNFV